MQVHVQGCVSIEECGGQSLLSDWLAIAKPCKRQEKIENHHVFVGNIHLFSAVKKSSSYCFKNMTYTGKEPDTGSVKVQ